MPKDLYVMTVETRDGSPLDIDPFARALGKSSTSIVVYSDTELRARLGLVQERPDLKVTYRPARALTSRA